MPENDLQVAFVSMQADTGAVTALVGGREYASFNRVTQGNRQPGSAIKPILYAAALEKGYTPLTFLNVGPTIFTFDSGREKYEPENVNGQFAKGEISLAQAIAISDNIYAVKTLENVGYGPFRNMAKRFNLKMPEGENPSIALGTIETSLYDITNAYNILASEGKKTTPTTVLSIKDSKGNTVYEYKKPKSEQVIKREDAFLMSQMMTGMFDPTFNDYSPVTGISIRSQALTRISEG